MKAHSPVPDSYTEAVQLNMLALKTLYFKKRRRGVGAPGWLRGAGDS